MNRLTKKARGAAFLYAAIKSRNADRRTFDKNLITAKRIPRRTLYAFLDMHGYKWQQETRIWSQRPNPKLSENTGAKAISNR